MKPNALQGWSYFGHHQFIDFRENGLHLGIRPQEAINDYRSGEKIVLDGPVPDDFTAAVTIDFRGNQSAGDAGILFRTSSPSVGYNAQRGYFAGIIPRAQIVILGMTDGSTWTELARIPADIDSTLPQRLQVTCAGPKITIQHNGKPALSHIGKTFPHGSLGLRVVDSHAIFSDVTITHPLVGQNR